MFKVIVIIIIGLFAHLNVLAEEEKKMIPVVKNKIPANSVITQDDIIFQEINAKSLRRDSIINIDDIVGKVSKYNIFPKMQIARTKLREAYTINKSDRVVMLYHNRFMTIQAAGIALDSGSLGAIIRVKNERSKTVVQGIVEGNKKIKIMSMDS